MRFIGGGRLGFRIYAGHGVGLVTPGKPTGHVTSGKPANQMVHNLTHQAPGNQPQPRWGRIHGGDVLGTCWGTSWQQ